jgi:hypothetical protein
LLDDHWKIGIRAGMIAPHATGQKSHQKDDGRPPPHRNIPLIVNLIFLI